MRHEKTLHEEDWNKAQIFIKKETNSSNGFSSSRRKGRLSSVSRSDEWKSSVSPPPHFATQTAALLSSTEASGFNQNSYVPQVNYSYSYPLIPGTQETADYPRESSIPNTSISSISQISPDQHYVEEQFLHQDNQHMPEQSAETYEESNVIPVDPNLFESPNTKTRLPSRSNASGCQEVLSVWSDIYASRDPLEYHREYENELERSKIYRDSQGQPIDSDLSLLRSISSLAQPPTLTVIKHEEALESLFLYTQFNCKQHGAGDTPDMRLFQRYLDQFFYYFNSRIPIFHLPTFEIKTTPAPLILAMCSIGASQASNHELSLALIHRANEHLENAKTETQPSGSSPSRPLWELQYQVLLLFACIFLNDSSTAAMAIERVGIFHREFPPLKAWLESNIEQSSSGSWKTWIEYETSKRVLYSMFIMSSLLTIIYDIAPCISTSQVLGLELSSDDALWEAPDERKWLALKSANISQLPRLKLKDLFTPLISGQGNLQMDELKEPSGLSNFSITTITHAVNVHVWNLRQCTPCSPQNFTRNDNNPEDEMQAFCINQAETSLARCRQLLENSLPEVTGYHKSTFDNLAVFNGFALLRSSFLRTFATEPSRSMHAALLSADDVTIQSACKEYAKEPWNRDEFMDNAAIKLFTGMLAPLYMWRGGRMEPELRMGLLEWNAEHSISVFDSGNY